MVIRVEDFNEMMYGNRAGRQPAQAPRQTNVRNNTQRQAAQAPARAENTPVARPQAEPARPTQPTYSAEDMDRAVRLARREMAERQSARRKGFWKRLGIGAALITVIGWFLNKEIKENGGPTQNPRPNLTQRLISAVQNNQEAAGQEIYEMPEREPIYVQAPPAVDFEIPVNVAYPVSGQIKQEFHRTQAMVRDYANDTRKTVDTATDFLGSVSDVLDSVGSVQNAKYRTAAERERLKRQKEIDKAKTERERLRVERERQEQKIRAQREKDRQADAAARRALQASREKERQVAAAAKRAEAQRKAAAQAAERQQKIAEANAKKAQAEAQRKIAEAKRAAQQRAAEAKRAAAKRAAASRRAGTRNGGK